MPDPTLSDAIKEAYSTARVDEVIYHTLELWHPSFSTPIRIVRDYNNIDAQIEATAARDAGTMQAFIGYAFDLVPPDQSAASLPECTIEIDNVSREIIAQIDIAASTQEKITVIYRSYLSGALASGPQNLPPLELTISRITATPLAIRAVAGFTNLIDQRFPSLDYDLDTYPGLLP